MPSNNIPREQFEGRMAKSVVEILDSYRLDTSSYDAKDVDKSNALAFSQALDAIKHDWPIPLVLPAFPFKSPNSMDKVLGVLPDKAEEVSLYVLQGLCDKIGRVYKHGARLVIVSDGIVYNDLLDVSDSIVWNYGEGLRQMARDNCCTGIEFARIAQSSEIKGIPKYLLSGLDEEKYLELAPLARRALMQVYSDTQLNINDFIASEPSVKATYLGYLKFLEKDLATSRLTYASSESGASASDGSSSSNSSTSSRKSFKRRIANVAKQMIARGRCFAAMIKKSYPNHIRLSIHSGTSPHKVPVAVLPNTSKDTCVTPWHCSMVCMLDGSFVPMKRQEIESSPKFEPVHRSGRLWCYREKSDLYDWGSIDVTFRHIYPSGLLVQAKQANTSFSSADMSKVRRLSEKNSPIILRGFAQTTDRELFLRKGREMGEIQKWKFGELLEVKDGGEENRGLNNVLSTEAMPWHYDGLFKVVNGVSTPPKFQMFVAKKPGQKGSGHTLFASSRLVFQHLPTQLTVDRLRHHTWQVSTASFDSTTLRGLPLVVEHPTQAMPAMRYHENWPKERTRFDETVVRIEGVGKEEDRAIRDAIEETLHDPRVCLRVSWDEGDVLVNDNIAVMHTREGYSSGCERELWRLHVD